VSRLEPAPNHLARAPTFHIVDCREKKANFELTNRVPLIIRAPGFPASAGKRTTVFYDHVDLYPTLAELAGLPSPQPAIGTLESKSLAKVFRNPGVLPSEIAGGQVAFSQYPRCAKTGIENGSCNNVDKRRFDYMGYSVRTAEWRFTAWLAWDGQTLKGQWAVGPKFYAEELYSHHNDTGTDHDAYENANVADQAQHTALKEQLWTLLQSRFPSIASIASIA
jgi:iduronate 2-sulfatase